MSAERSSDRQRKWVAFSLVICCQMIRQLQADVDMQEMAELERLETGDENAQSVAAVRVVRAQMVAADTELPAGLRVAYAYALPITGVAGESGCSASVGALNSILPTKHHILLQIPP